MRGLLIGLLDTYRRLSRWWLSFERAGGYAAGFATGLLGFAQIFWDPNRQAIHDKVSETIVIQDGKAPLPGPWIDEGRAMWKGGGDADTIIEAKGLKQITDSGAIEAMIDEIIAANPTQVEQYRAGKQKVFGFFVGQVMKASKGKANPQQVNALLKERLKA